MLTRIIPLAIPFLLVACSGSSKATTGKEFLKKFQEAIKVLTILRSGWAELAEREAVQTTVPPELLAQQAAGPGLTLRG